MTTPSTGTDRVEASLALPTEALVLGAEEERVRVRLVASSGEIRARVAVPGYHPVEGDRVLVQETADGGVYVLGIVHAVTMGTSPPNPARPPAVTAPGGASASVEGDHLALRDREGRLLLTVDGATGEIRLEATKDLRLSAKEGRVTIEAQALDLSVGHYELRAERILERATDVLRTAEGILETRAQHARTVVSRTLSFFSRRTTIASEEDTHVDGKRVLLG